ncbi:uncharacterized protein LOC123394744 [Mustela putorius furo]|uniref:Uncharacterized protein LOC123394744 n=1 Tax=Mustela putorius furo TaxID=9669 RepID=A0A8U0VA15_MUSPF|nr:uncharacterized protein LOC123394744 [Mustela putorius furo]
MIPRPHLAPPLTRPAPWPSSFVSSSPLPPLLAQLLLLLPSPTPWAVEPGRVARATREAGPGARRLEPGELEWGRGTQCGTDCSRSTVSFRRPLGDRATFQTPRIRSDVRTEVTRGQGKVGEGRSGRIWHTTAEKELGDLAVCGQERVNRANRSCVAQSLTWAARFCSIVNRGPGGECPDDDVTNLPPFSGIVGGGVAERQDLETTRWAVSPALQDL